MFNNEIHAKALLDSRTKRDPHTWQSNVTRTMLLVPMRLLGMSTDTKHKVPGHRGVGITVRNMKRLEEIRINYWGPEVWKGIQPWPHCIIKTNPLRRFSIGLPKFTLSSSRCRLASSGVRRENQKEIRLMYLVPKNSEHKSVMYPWLGLCQYFALH